MRGRRDDPSALEMIWERYAPDMLGYLTGLHCSRHDAEDTLQEVFVTIARKRESVAKARFLKPYLFQLARLVKTELMMEERNPIGQIISWG
jgi:DNA-directed RNA polymerase specialized sigma24 family protein